MEEIIGPDIHPALKPFQAEIDAAALANDMETVKALVLRAGLEWQDHFVLPEKYRSDIHR